MEITEALKKLDPENDEHWTNQGLPALNPLAEILGVKNVKREQVTEADPQFNREAARQSKQEPGPAADDQPTEQKQDEASEEDEGEKDIHQLIADADAEVEAIRHQKTELERELTKAQNERDRLITIRDSGEDRHHNQREIIRHIQRQNEARKAQRTPQPGSAAPSDLDASLSVKKTRPSYPNKREQG